MITFLSELVSNQLNFTLSSNEQKFLQNEECPKLLSSLGIDHRRRKTIPLWNSPGEKRVLQGITVCLVSTILGTV